MSTNIGVLPGRRTSQSRQTQCPRKRQRTGRFSSWAFWVLLLGVTRFAGAQQLHLDTDAHVDSGYGPRIQQVQLTTDPRRPLDSRISAMPRADQKLEIIHRRSQLVVTKLPIRRIAWTDPAVLDVVQFSPTEISILGMEMGGTDLWLWFEGQDQPLMYVVQVIRDPSYEEQRKIDYGRIERKIALLYPNSKVYLIPMTRRIIVRGQASDTEEAARIIQIVRSEVAVQEGNGYGYDNLLGVGPGYGGRGGGGGGGYGGNYFDELTNNNTFNSLVVDELQVPGEFQIAIHVRVAELNRSQLRRMGIDWNVLINDGAAFISQSFATGPNPILTGVFDSGNVNVLVDALASNGTARVMNDARVITLSGEPAAFLAGGEFAVPTIVGIGGAQGQQTSFRGFGTSIIVTPTLVDHDLIRMQIVPEISAINSDNSVGGIPGVDVRRVQTRVELREGQTIVLGGVFSRREAAEVTRIPFLGEIPLVGHLLFNAKQATEDETELLIVVTPELIRPMEPDQVPPLPGWYVTHPDDIDLYKYNRIEGNPDLGNYQLLPYGNGQGFGQDVGYNYFNPQGAGGQLGPFPTGGSVAGPYDGTQGGGYGGGYPQEMNGYPQTSPGQTAYPGQPQQAPVYQGQPVPNSYPGGIPQSAPHGYPQNSPQPAIVPPANYPPPQLNPTPAQTGQYVPATGGVQPVSGTVVAPGVRPR